jgi:hypothetical protein
VVSVRAELSFARVPVGGVELLGIAGPGVVTGTSSPARVADAGTSTPVDLRGALDCAAVPIPAPRGAYGVRARVRDGSRPATGVLAAGALAGPLAAAVETACGSWLARRDLTVTAASARVDRVRPLVDLTLTVANRGSREAELSLAPLYGLADGLGNGLDVRASGPQPIRLPAAAAGTVRAARGRPRV